MTLRRQFFIGLTLLFFSLLAGSIVTDTVYDRKSLHEQLTLRAQETANLLAYSIAALDTSNKKPAIESLANTAFNQGYFNAVTYQDAQDNVLVDRRRPAQKTPIPDWFNKWLPIKPAMAQAAVDNGRGDKGTITIISNTDIAYIKLWEAFQKQVLLFAFIYAGAFLLASIAINRLLKPLQRVEVQAAAICNRQFIEQQPLPRTREMRQVVEAINHMSRKLKIIFNEQLAFTESLRAQSCVDPVTGLSNRRDFNARLQAVADSESGSGGCLMILQISDFGHYNLQYGHEAGDECLRAVAEQLQTNTANAPDAIVSRRAGADFAIYLPSETQDSAVQLANKLIADTADLVILFQHQIHIGLSCCNILRADHKLLAEADMALRQAQSCGQSNGQLFQRESGSKQFIQDASQWYTTLNRILQHKLVSFHYQPMFLLEDSEALAAEIFCRINVHEKVIPAGIFLPMAERFGMAEAFDRLIIDTIRTRSEAAYCDSPICINLSPRSVRAAEFVDWLGSYLHEHPIFARRLIIETSEYLIKTGHEYISYLCNTLHRYGARLSLDHFGIHSAAFGYLRSIPVNFVKIDRSFIRDIHLNPDNQFYVKSLVHIAHSCDIIIMAEGVESAQEWDCLCQLGIDGGQGYFLGKPENKINRTRE